MYCELSHKSTTRVIHLSKKSQIQVKYYQGPVQMIEKIFPICLDILLLKVREKWSVDSQEYH